VDFVEVTAFGRVFKVRSLILKQDFLRFMSQVDIGVGKGGCWRWIGPGHIRKPYGTFYYRGANVSAHRFSYFALRGQIEPYRHLHHRIEHPINCIGGACVNPSHLIPVTPEEHVKIHGFKFGIAPRRTNCELCGKSLTPYTSPAGKIAYRCNPCRNEKRNKEYATAHPKATTCGNGHARTKANLVRDGNRWRCKLCQTASMIKYKANHCYRGHKLTKRTTGYDSKGDWYCKECRKVSSSPKSKIKKLKWKSEGHQKDWTHCNQGHEFTPDNTKIQKDGSRACRQCHRERQREYWHRTHPDAPFNSRKGPKVGHRRAQAS